MNNPNQSKTNNRLQSFANNLFQQFNNSSQSSDIKLGIWGATGSGKTTYLGRLYTELLNSENWTVYASQKSLNYINDIVGVLDNGIFPPFTNPKISKLKEYDYRLTGEEQPFKGVNVMLRFIDAPGEWYENPDLGKQKVEVEGQELSIDILEYLSGCHGIIFLLDPEQKRLPEKKKLSFVLLKLMQEFHERYNAQFQDNKVRKLQQYMAFCVTKVDKGDFWQESVEPEKFAKRVMGTEIYQRLQNNFCLGKRLNFYPVSSIGRYKEGEQWKEAVNYLEQNDPEPTDNQSNEVSRQNQSIFDILNPKIEFEPQKELTNQEPSSTNSSADDNYGGLSPSSPSESEQSSKGLTTFDVEKEPVPIGILEPIEWLIKEIRANPPSLPKQTSIQAEQPPFPPFSR